MVFTRTVHEVLDQALQPGIKKSEDINFKDINTSQIQSLSKVEKGKITKFNNKIRKLNYDAPPELTYCFLRGLVSWWQEFMNNPG